MQLQVTHSLTQRQMFIVSSALKIAQKTIRQEDGVNSYDDLIDEPVTTDEIQRLLDMVDYRS